MKSFDRRWIFLTIGLIVFVLLKFPFQLQYSPSVQTMGTFNALEGLSPGSTIFLAVDYGPSTQAEILPMHEAMLYQLLKKDIKIIAGSVIETGPPLTDNTFEKIAQELKEEGIAKKYGVDFVNLGFKSGNDVAIAKIGASIPETFPIDYRGNNVEDLPIMDGIVNFDQISLLISYSSGTPGTRQWLHQIQTRYKVRMVAGVTAVQAPDLYSFFQSNQLEGFLGGLVGAAEYEYLLDRPGNGMAGMNVQSICHIFILGLILFGNIIYFRGRRKNNLE